MFFNRFKRVFEAKALFFYNYKAAELRRIGPMVKAEEKKAEEVDKLNL